MSVNISLLGGVAAQFFDNNGNTLSGGKIYTYLAGTTTAEPTYTSVSGATAHTNPIILDSAGRVPGGEIWVSSNTSYKFVIYTSTGVLIGSYDNLQTFASNAEDVIYNPPFANAVETNVEAKLAQTVSVMDFGATGDGVTDDTAAIQNAINSIRHTFYNKGSGKIIFPAPQAFYKISATLDLTEIWNVTLEGDNPNFHQRQGGSINIDNENSTFHWYGNTTDPMIRADYTFGAILRNLSFNGREIAKIGIAITPPSTRASVTRTVIGENIGVKYCDFGLVVGELIGASDNGPINFYNLIISNCTSAGLLYNSGNAYATFEGVTLGSNGFAPTTGNSFISDANNVGAQYLHTAGYMVMTGLVSDFGNDTDAPVVATVVHSGSGSIRFNGVWDDGPSKPFYVGGGSRSMYFNGVTHYSAEQTPTSTPTSIIYNGSQPLVMESCYVYGNVEINSGTGASVIDLGTVFVRSGAGFTGDMVTTFGGLIRNVKLGNNMMGQSIGGTIPADLPYPAHTVWADTSGIARVLATRNTAFNKVTESVINGQYNLLNNCYYDNATSTFKAIKAGFCSRVLMDGLEWSCDSLVAASDGETLNWALPAGWIHNVGQPNGGPAANFGGFRLLFETSFPTVGSWVQGDRIFKADPVAGGIEGWVCVTSGTPGTWKEFGSIAA